MSNSDALRSRLPTLAGEMSYTIGVALTRMREAAKAADQPADWRKGMQDALKLMRGVSDANDHFKAWMKQVVALEADHCGLTVEECADVVRYAPPQPN
jgi:hypothetical protein